MSFLAASEESYLHKRSMHTNNKSMRYAQSTLTRENNKFQCKYWIGISIKIQHCFSFKYTINE
jgi:hypothetical protein